MELTEQIDTGSKFCGSKFFRNYWQNLVLYYRDFIQILASEFPERIDFIQSHTLPGLNALIKVRPSS